MKKIIGVILMLALAFLPTAGASEAHSRILVACFSATGNTAQIADAIAEVTSADRFAIVPEELYTTDDLNYNTDCRANREQNDEGARPAIAGDLPSVEAYDVIFLGYPIWWGKLPKIMITFLEACDLNGKTVVPFCTSGSSGIATSVSEIRALQTGANILEGRRFDAGADADEVHSWLNELDFTNDYGED